MPATDLALDRTVLHAINAFTVARCRTEMLVRDLDRLARGYATVGANLAAIRAALDRLGVDLRVIIEATGWGESGHLSGR